MTQKKILDHLGRIAGERNIRLLYACETGSRGWGFASPDSDWDVRFIYVHPRDAYLSVGEPQDTITLMFEDGGDELDFNGWDLRKTLHHLRKSNATPFEWLQSPFVYLEEPGFRDELWALSPSYFVPRAAVHHYLGICHNAIKTGIAGDHIKIKKYFYILRPLLAAIWAADRRSVPPMEFGKLLPQIEGRNALMAAIARLLAEKEVAAEGEIIPLVPVIQEFITAEMERCRSLASEMESVHADVTPLNLFFRKNLTPD